MLNRIDGYWIETISPFGALQSVTIPFPQGTNVFASISLSFQDTLFSGNLPDPTFAAAAFIDSWTFYEPDGTQSSPQSGSGFNQNSVKVDNCASITFILFAWRVWAIGQISVISS